MGLGHLRQLLLPLRQLATSGKVDPEVNSINSFRQ
jgi:hypothetical protein